MKVTGKNTMWEGRFIKTSVITYEDKKGEERQWEAVERTNCDGIVIIIPITEERDVILIRQFRAVHDKYVVELPAGLIESGEEILAAARRELIEETGYSSDTMEPLTKGVMSTGIDTDEWHVILARGVKKASTMVRNSHPPDESEDIEVVTFPLDTVYEQMEGLRGEGNEIDLRIYGLLELAKREMASS